MLALCAALRVDPTPCSLWGLDAAAIAAMLNDSRRCVLVAMVAEHCVGLGILTRGEKYQRHLGELTVAVAPDCRRRGIARALIVELQQQALKDGLARLKGLVDTRNTASQALFSSCGFAHRATLYGEFRSEEFGEIDDCVFYQVLD
jgi:L-amino acid N-acyltransferase YncA